MMSLKYFNRPKIENGFSIFLMLIFVTTALFLLSLTFLNSALFSEGWLINVFLILTTYLNLFYLCLIFFPALWIVFKLIPNTAFRILFSLITGMVFTYVVIDKFAFNQFKFHINNFILKVFTEPGALQVLGIGFVEVSLIIGVILAGCLVTYFVYTWLIRSSLQNRTLRFFDSWPKRILLVFLILTVLIVDKMTFAWLLYQQNRSVYTLAKRLPFYMTTQAGRFFSGLGFEQTSSGKNQPSLTMAKQNINYPLEPYKPSIIKSENRLPNIILLMSDALRKDAYSKTLMPNSYKAFNPTANNFQNHYSGSNGTTQALFSMLYGLPPNYMTFYSRAEVSPIIFDALMAYDYQIKILSSKSLGWLGTDQVVFSTVKQFIEDEFAYSSTQSDAMMTDRAIKVLNDHKNDSKRPLFLMVFYDSTHLPHFEHPDFKKYQPSDTGVLFDPRKPEHRKRGFNEYRNAVDYVDHLLEKVYRPLKKYDYFKNSIVILTSDHGSEKYEHGHWGHASAFTNEQLQVPFLLSYPGSRQKQIAELTSHLDISATLLDIIGEKYPLENHTVGQSMINLKPRDFIMAGGMANRVLIDSKYKIDYTPFELISYYKVMTIDDKPVEDQDQVISAYTPKILKMFHLFQKYLK